jgi:hypothetical protein
MYRLKPLTKQTPLPAFEDTENLVDLLRSILTLIERAREVLGLNIPRKD